MSTMAFRPHKVKKSVTLSITPLIDVLFLLIIFFTLTSTFKRVGELELQLPDSSTSQTVSEDEERHTIDVVVMEDGELLVDGDAIELPRLKSRLAELRAADAEGRVMIKAEAGVNHGDVVRLLDIVRDAGFPGVGIGTHTRPPEPEPTAPGP
jgi:biopolymer transport protein ExbD